MFSKSYPRRVQQLALLTVAVFVATPLLTHLLQTRSAFPGNTALADDERRSPLDVPSGGRGNNDEEEDPPEIISFYGGEYEADGFFWCIDRSGSMTGAAIANLKVEMTSAIQQLSNNSEFCVTRFNQSVDSWSIGPKRATAANKQAAIAWVQTTTATGTTCIAPAVSAALVICNQSNRPNRRLILVGDGLPECPPPNSSGQNTQTLNDIVAANYQGVPIDTIFIANNPQGVALFQQIAAANQGQFSNPQ